MKFLIGIVLLVLGVGLLANGTVDTGLILCAGGAVAMLLHLLQD